MRFKHLLRGAASAMVLTGIAAGQAFAQDQELAQDDVTQFDELVVTAQKREQRLQDVPVVVTVAGEQQLEDAGVRDIRDLTILTPGLIVTSTSNETSTSARIRGVGTVGDNPGLESSVGVVIDGIYRPRNGVGFNDLGELERIEVLKGPQGTLFGKNTSSGVINIITKDPSFTPGYEVTVTGGNYDYLAAGMSLTGPLVQDVLAGRLYVGYGDRAGFQDVYRGTGPALRPREDQDQHFYTVRGQLAYAGSETLDARLIADYTKRDENCCVGVQLVSGSFVNTVTNNALLGGPTVLAPPNIGRRLAFANRPTEQRITDQGVSLEVNWDTPWLGDATLTSLTGVRRWETNNGQDSDFTSADLLYREDQDFFRDFSQFSQELRLAGEEDRLSWLVGAFYAKEELDSGEALNFGTQLNTYLDILLRTAAAAPVASGGTGTLANPVTGGGLGYILGATNPVALPGAQQRDVHNQESTTTAFFINSDFRVTDALTLTSGLRWTQEDKDRLSQYRNIGALSNGGTGGACTPSILAPGGAASRAANGGVLAQRLFVGYFCSGANDAAYNNLNQAETISEDELTGTLKLAYRLNEDVMTYVSWASGYKSGGFNLYRQRQGSAANPSGVLTPDPTTAFRPETVDSYELGAKTTWFDRSLVLNSALFYQKFSDYQLNAFDGVDFNVVNIPTVRSKGVDIDLLWNTPVEGLSVQAGATYAETKYGSETSYLTPATTGFARLPNRQISFAPELSATLSTTYERTVGELLMRGNVSAKYTDEYNTGSDLSPLKAQPDLTLVNARIGIGPVSETWSLEVWGQNITDREYIQVAFDGTFQPNQVNAFLGAPQTWGVTLRIRN
jgi:outer membrane receptor protein involved in Fe transport